MPGGLTLECHRRVEQAAEGITQIIGLGHDASCG
jgi:succinyl-CoA synthetase alpha subunit